MNHFKKPLEEIKKPRQKSQVAPKTKGKPTIKRVSPEKQTVKTVNNDIHKIKQTKKSFDGTSKGIKTADKSVKTAKATAKTTANTTKKTAETTRRTAEATKVAVRATANTIRAVVQAIEEGAKAIASAAKSLAALIVEGGVPAVIIVIIICLIGAIGGTCFGIFLANDESTGTERTMSMTISDLNSEHYERLTELKASYTYDLLEIQGDMTVGWKDVLAVYAVKTTSGDTPLEVVTLNDVKINLLRTIMQDMNKMTAAVSPRIVSETTVTTDEDGNTVRNVTYTTKQVLTITIQKLTIDEIVTQYSFNQEQKDILNELLSDEYSDLWADLLGASGQIIQGNSSFVGTSIFAWPFENDQYISSRFGTRVDPFTGEIRTHGGTDIAAPMGTPILASADGTVVAATWHNSYGYYVKIKHNDTYSTLYAHCSALHVSVGQTVRQGQIIADCGSTGNSTGPHCHFEVIQNGVRVDALMFFN